MLLDGSLWPQRTPSDGGVEFLDQETAALRSRGRVVEFEGEASHRAEIRGRAAFVHVIEQSGANIVDRIDVDPGLSVGQSIDASARRGVRPYRERREGITAMSCKRHLLLPLRSFPGETSVVATPPVPRSSDVATCERWRVRRQLALWPRSGRGHRRRSIRADDHVGSDRDLLHRLSACVDVEPIHVGILPLVKAQIPDLHEISFDGH